MTTEYNKVLQSLRGFYLRYLQQYKIFRSIAFLTKYILWVHTKHKMATPTVPSWTRESQDCITRDELCIAVICDDMTWANFQGECRLAYLTPSDWFDTLEREKPDILFCEATWTGIRQSQNCWEGLIAKDTSIWGDNRFVLKEILGYCKKANVITVFWNKEDPPGSGTFLHDFQSTALLFDYIFTTAQESVIQYEKAGHLNIHTMMFGFSPRLFYPTSCKDNSNTAAFFGGWYENQPERCEDACKLFEAVLNRGMKLVIYDRASDLRQPDRVFPQKYQSYIRPAVEYEEIRELLSGITYVINLNTVKTSNTMFARRVFETIACGRLIISNDSLGMRRLFPGGVWYPDEPFEWENKEDIIARNTRLVFSEHTFSHRLDELFKVVGLNVTEFRQDGGGIVPKV